MPEFTTIRNDDVAVDLDFEQFKKFCNVCDRYGYKIIQCVTPIGNAIPIDARMNNSQILAFSGDDVLADNKALLDFLLSRNDPIAIHGLFHTHRPTHNQIEMAKSILVSWGLKPEYLVWPFNEETEDTDIFCGLKVVRRNPSLEKYLFGLEKMNEIPQEEVCYLHSWRFFEGRSRWYLLENLEKTLERIRNGR